MTTTRPSWWKAPLIRVLELDRSLFVYEPREDGYRLLSHVAMPVQDATYMDRFSVEVVVDVPTLQP